MTSVASAQCQSTRAGRRWHPTCQLRGGYADCAVRRFCMSAVPGLTDESYARPPGVCCGLRHPISGSMGPCPQFSTRARRRQIVSPKTAAARGWKPSPAFSLHARFPGCFPFPSQRRIDHLTDHQEEEMSAQTFTESATSPAIQSCVSLTAAQQAPISRSPQQSGGTTSSPKAGLTAIPPRPGSRCGTSSLRTSPSPCTRETAWLSRAACASARMSRKAARSTQSTRVLVDELGPSLRFATAEPKKTRRSAAPERNSEPEEDPWVQAGLPGKPAEAPPF
jgi:hypothetical protein